LQRDYRVFDNREGFPGLFNSAEMWIYSYVGADLRVCPLPSRDKQDVYDTTGNMQVDYTLFGFENEVVEARN
jgi:hypothetical protein